MKFSREFNFAYFGFFAFPGCKLSRIWMSDLTLWESFFADFIWWLKLNKPCGNAVVKSNLFFICQLKAGAPV